MKTEIETQLRDAAARLRSKGLFAPGNDRLSMRVPGSDEILIASPEDDKIVSANLAIDSVHATVYRNRPDAGAVLIGTTKWSIAIAALGETPPLLFDEPARHIGAVPPLVSPGDHDALLAAIQTGTNAIFYGPQCIRIGMTRDRIVFNAELFEKCAMAFVLAKSSGTPLQQVPGWVVWIAGRRLKKDQRRAAAAYAHGEIPVGMNSY
jgi:ribulose-5-phosphate 4-epimerase/fuculose-1-phosphate aldolase